MALKLNNPADAEESDIRTRDPEQIIRDLISVMPKSGQPISLKGLYKLLNQKHSLHILRKYIVALAALENTIVRVSIFGNGRGISYFIAASQVRPLYTNQYYDAIYELESEPANKGE